MKPNLMLSLLAAFATLFYLSCGPTEAEIREKIKNEELEASLEKERSARMQEVLDSMAELARIEEKRRQKAETNELKETLVEREISNARDYIEYDYDIDIKPISGKDVVKIKITNSASIATFKDFEFEITCKAKTGAVKNTFTKTFHEFLPPQTTKTFEHKFRSPDGTKTIGVELIQFRATE